MPRPHTKKGALSPALPPVRRKRSNPFNALVRRVANLSVPSADLSAQGAITGELTETAAEQIPEKVVRLSISQSAITGLTESFLRHERMANIETLKLRHNQLSDLPDSFSCLSKLVKLYLEGNCFTTFPSVLCEMKQLKVISLEHNQIRHLPDNITHLTSLEVLYLRNNRIAVLPLGLLQSTSLHKLAVDDNPLICPPLYITERGVSATRKYLEIMEEEKISKGTVFDYRVVGPFTTATVAHANAFSLIPHEQTKIYYPDEIRQWRNEFHENFYFTIQIGLTLNRGRRNYMEDRAEAKAFEPFPELLPQFKAAFVGVYDGHGGASVAEYVVKNLRGHIIRQWRSLFHARLGRETVDEAGRVADDPFSPEERDEAEKLSLRLLPTAMVDGFASAEKCIEDRYKRTGNDDGTTAVVAILVHNRLYMAHCGDSRAVMVRGAMEVPLTRDHKPNNPQERKRIESTGHCVKKIGSTWRVDGNLAVARSLGDCSHKPAISSIPEISMVILNPSDSYLVLASDGLWDVISNEEAAEIIVDTVRARDCSEDLVKKALDKLTGDNLSVIVVALRWNVTNNYHKDYLNDTPTTIRISEREQELFDGASCNLHSYKRSNKRKNQESRASHTAMRPISIDDLGSSLQKPLITKAKSFQELDDDSNSLSALVSNPRVTKHSSPPTGLPSSRRPRSKSKKREKEKLEASNQTSLDATAATERVRKRSKKKHARISTSFTLNDNSPDISAAVEEMSNVSEDDGESTECELGVPSKRFNRFIDDEIDDPLGPAFMSLPRH